MNNQRLRAGRKPRDPNVPKERKRTTFSRYLERKRSERQWSQTEIAMRIREQGAAVDSAWVSKWERGVYQDMSPDMMARYAQALHVPVWKLSLAYGGLDPDGKEVNFPLPRQGVFPSLLVDLAHQNPTEGELRFLWRTFENLRALNETDAAHQQRAEAAAQASAADDDATDTPDESAARGH